MPERHILLRRNIEIIIIHINILDSNAWNDKLWTEHAINFWGQKGNKLYTESVIFNGVDKLSSKICQNLLTCYASKLTAEIIQYYRGVIILLDFCCQSTIRLLARAGPAQFQSPICWQHVNKLCRQILSKVVEQMALIESTVKIWSNLLPSYQQIASIMLSGYENLNIA